MTHLGITSLAAVFSRGFGVIGYDSDTALIEALDRGELPFFEPDLSEVISKHDTGMRFSSKSDDLSECGVVFIALDVPTDDQGRSSLAPILESIKAAEQAIRPDAVLVVLSQVPPNFTRALSRAKTTLFYQVETLIFGKAFERAMYPERIIIGCADPQAPLPDAYRLLLEAFDCPLLQMHYESAELCKISINMLLAASVTTSNVIAELCENIGADWSEIISALRMDKRIGENAYLDPGLGISGGNLERDLATFCQFAGVHGCDDQMVRSWIRNSAYRKNWPLRTLFEELEPIENLHLAVLGLAYKENTNSTMNSPSLEFLACVPTYPVTAYDPEVVPSKDHHPLIKVANDSISAVAEADVVLILTPWPEFRTIDPKVLAKTMRGNVLIDPYGMLDTAECNKVGLRHRVLGRNV